MSPRAGPVRSAQAETDGNWTNPCIFASLGAKPHSTPGSQAIIGVPQTEKGRTRPATGATHHRSVLWVHDLLSTKCRHSLRQRAGSHPLRESGALRGHEGRAGRMQIEAEAATPVAQAVAGASDETPRYRP